MSEHVEGTETGSVGKVITLPGPVDGFLNLEMVADALGVCSQTVVRAVRKGKFPTPSRIGRRMLWPRKAILAHLENPS